MKSVLKALAVSIVLANAAGVAAPALADGIGREAARRNVSLPRNEDAGTTSLYSIFRGGRYDTPPCFVADPLSQECPIKPWGS